MSNDYPALLRAHVPSRTMELAGSPALSAPSLAFGGLPWRRERDRLNRSVSWKLTAPHPFLSRCQSLCLLLLLWVCGQRVRVVHHVHSVRGLHLFAPDRHRRAIAECLMKATTIVEGDPVCDSCLGLAPFGIALEVDVLVAAGKAANLAGERPVPSIARSRTASISDARGGNKPRCART